MSGTCQRRCAPRHTTLTRRALTTDKSTCGPGHSVGAGLAGSEAAWQVASSGIPVVLHEMRPQ
ncbi:FAD-dependent oxidoreductase, partial [Acinetobacter baumannii]